MVNFSVAYAIFLKFLYCPDAKYLNSERESSPHGTENYFNAQVWRYYFINNPQQLLYLLRKKIQSPNMNCKTLGQVLIYFSSLFWHLDLWSLWIWSLPSSVSHSCCASSPHLLFLLYKRLPSHPTNQAPSQNSPWKSSLAFPILSYHLLIAPRGSSPGHLAQGLL